MGNDIPKDTNIRRTPPHILRWLRDGLGLDIWLDVACDGEHNAVAPVFIEKETDGLRASWSSLRQIFLSKVARREGLSWAWCNPPYGRGHVARWIDKAQSEAELGVETALLLPADLSTRWAGKLMWYMGGSVTDSVGGPSFAWLRWQTVFFRGRLVFDQYDSGARFPSMLVFVGRRLPHLPDVSVVSNSELLEQFGSEGTC